MKDRIKRYIPFVLSVGIIITLSLYAFGVIGEGSHRSVANQNYDIGAISYAYSGDLFKNKFNGKGVIKFAEGDTYEGDFVDGRFSGYGIYKDLDGWYYEGGFVDGKMSGNGELHTAEGDTLTTKENEAETFLSSKNFTYVGQTGLRGQIGSGRFTFSDGSFYEGDFLHGLADGKGKYTTKDGVTIYEGDFKNGNFDGSGTYTSKDKKITYSGDFKDGLFSGNGEYKEDGALKYKGQFSAGLCDGDGEFFSKEGWSYKGKFKKGVFDGKGEITDKNGKKTTGTWSGGVRKVYA